MKFKVALAQTSTSEEKSVNLKKGVRIIEEASEKGADLVVLPELFMAYAPLNRMPARLVKIAEEVDGPFVRRLSDAASKRRINVIVGILEKSGKKDKVYNTVVMIDSDGRVVSTHRKLQLFDSFGFRESSRFEPSPGLEGAFKTKLAKMGMMTCYELRFPEIARILALQGAKLIVVPTAWVAGRMKEEHLQVLASARAIENTVYVAVASQTGRIFTGRSLVVDPFGVKVCDAGEEECLAIAEIDTNRVARVRRILPSLSHIRGDVYNRFTF